MYVPLTKIANMGSIKNHSITFLYMCVVCVCVHASVRVCTQDAYIALSFDTQLLYS